MLINYTNKITISIMHALWAEKKFITQTKTHHKIKNNKKKTEN